MVCITCLFWFRGGPFSAAECMIQIGPDGIGYGCACLLSVLLLFWPIWFPRPKRAKINMWKQQNNMKGNNMTKTQILNFLKAPFGKSFIVAYLFTLPTLLVVPLISKLISFIVDHHHEISAISEEEIPQFILSHFENIVNIFAKYFN